MVLQMTSATHKQLTFHTGEHLVLHIRHGSSQVYEHVNHSHRQGSVDTPNIVVQHILNYVTLRSEFHTTHHHVKDFILIFRFIFQ